jgi:cytochrome c peroxidase
MKKPDIVVHWGRATCVALFGAMALAACGGAPTSIDVAPTEADVATTESAATTEDGLAEAYALFKQLFVNNGFDQDFTMGFAFHQALSTEKLLGPNGFAVNGVMTLHFASKTISGVVVEAPTNVPFDLWFVKNVAGSGRTVKPESGDQLIKVASSQLIDGTLFFNANIGNSVNFDLDMVVLTRRGQSPTVSRIAVGSRTILEKRFFRERAGKTLDPVTGALANNVETTDALVERGAQLFFNETFAGNGRTCGTCHRAERSLTIDPPFIATLPSTDPLFVAETNPALRALENPTLLRQRGLIRENLDGFEDPTHNFVQRGVPHTLGLATTDGRANGAEFAPQLFLGWGGDGAPGRGTLNEFSFGAIFQHFTKTLSRRPGIDFRIPTQEELDALEAFQMFSGRQKMPVVVNLVPRDASAASGRTLFFGQQAQCTSCHGDLSGGITINNNFATDVAKLTPELPVDDGFDFGTFNVPPLIEAADTPPLFHNNFAADIEAAVAFYVTDTFANSPSGSNLSRIVLNATEQANIAAFLRVINAAENIREVRKRVTFVRTHRSPGNTSLLIAAIADTGDAINVLSAKNLNQAAVSELRDVKQTLEIAQANADPDRAPFMDHALDFLNLAKAQLFSANPDNDF